jgi:hypothetical protein
VKNPENGRLLAGAIHWAKQARTYASAPATSYRDACLDRMLALQLAAELAPPPEAWGPGGWWDGHRRADEVAELLVVALRPEGQ